MARKKDIVKGVSPELIRAQAAELRGVDIDPQRAAELAADIARVNDAVAQERRRFDFNDEPARFAALLMQFARSPDKHK